jgi:arylsulfatase
MAQPSLSTQQKAHASIPSYFYKSNALFLLLLAGAFSMASFNLSLQSDSPQEANAGHHTSLYSSLFVFGTMPTGSGNSQQGRQSTRTLIDMEPVFAEPKQPLNVVLLYGDDWRHDSLGIAGTQLVQTPFLDRLARENLRFTHNCVTSSICWISRATLHTGMYYSRHRTKATVDPKFYKLWDHSFPTHLKKAGYHLGHVGKWNFPMEDADKHVWNTYDYFKPYEAYHWFEMGGQRMVHVTQRNEDDGIDFLQKRPKDKPFFLNVAFFAPHAEDPMKEQYRPQPKSMSLYENDTIPYPPNGKYRDWAKFKNKSFTDSFEGRARYNMRFNSPTKHQIMIKNYYRLITEVDSACEKIYEELERQGIENETMIIFTTDNGYLHAEHGLAGKWVPLEESLRTPLIIKDPRMHPKHKGTTNEEFTLSVDLAPTILAAAGLAAPELMQGRDISELYRKDSTDWRTEFLYELPYLLDVFAWPSARGLVRKDYKYIEYIEYNSSQFFDMKADPNEASDLSAQPKHKVRISEMKQRMEELQEAAKMPESHASLFT